jgi:vitamin B12 transporter
MIRTSALLSATALTALLTAPAAAQTVFELDEVIFTANAAPIELERIGTSASVVTAEELEATAETRVIDYLARLPGVDVRSRGPIGTQSSISIRGIGQNYVRVIVDGIDVTDVAGPQVAYDFGALTTMDVERIEVLRGGQSALYGSEAIGGVINITTRRPEENTVRQFVTLEAGSYGTFTGSYGVAADHGALDYALTLSRTQTDGFSAADENAGNAEADGFESNRFSFSVGYDIDATTRIGFNGFYEVSEGEFDDTNFFGPPPVFDGTTDDVTENTTTGLRAFVEFQTGDIDNSLALTYYEFNRDFTNASGFGPFNGYFNGERVGLNYLGTATLTPELDVRFGFDFTRETFASQNNFNATPNTGENEVFGVFSEFAWAPTADLDVVATLRLDDHSQFGNLASGRLAASWRPAEDWIVRTSLAHSFRAPSLFELYGPNGTLTLEPEESRSFDMGVERRFGPDTFVRATYFYNETDNLIDFIDGFYVQIPGTVTRQGVELEAGAPIGARWRLDGSYTYTEGENPVLSGGNTFNSEFPEHDLSLTATGDLTDRVSAAFTVQSAWDRPTLGDYTVANATVSYEISNDIEAYLRIENIFDEEYQLQNGYGTSDRAFYVGLRASF